MPLPNPAQISRSSVAWRTASHASSAWRLRRRSPCRPRRGCPVEVTPGCTARRRDGAGREAPVQPDRRPRPRRQIRRFAGSVTRREPDGEGMLPSRGTCRDVSANREPTLTRGHNGRSHRLMGSSGSGAGVPIVPPARVGPTACPHPPLQNQPPHFGSALTLFSNERVSCQEGSWNQGFREEMLRVYSQALLTKKGMEKEGQWKTEPCGEDGQWNGHGWNGPL